MIFSPCMFHVGKADERQKSSAEVAPAVNTSRPKGFAAILPTPGKVWVLVRLSEAQAARDGGTAWAELLSRTDPRERGWSCSGGESCHS